MEHEIYWGILVALYLFLAGAGAGVLFISAYYVLDERIKDVRYFKLSFYSAIAGFLLLVIGTGMIVLDLTTFQAGLGSFDLDKLFRFHKLFMVFVPNSIMSLGSWLLFFSIPVSIIYALSFIEKYKLSKFRVFLARINMIIGLFVCSYTAFLLGDVTHNIVWSKSVMIVLFIASALSSGVAVVLFLRMIIFKSDIYQSEEITFSKADGIILTFEFICALIFAYAIFVSSNVSDYKYILTLDNKAGVLWWGGAVILGLIIPLLINIYSITLKKRLSHFFEFTIIASVLVGAFCLRYSILLSGQMY